MLLQIAWIVDSSDLQHLAPYSLNAYPAFWHDSLLPEIESGRDDCYVSAAFAVIAFASSLKLSCSAPDKQQLCVACRSKISQRCSADVPLAGSRG